MRWRRWWRFALASSVVSLVVCAPVKSQELNPLEQAAPCKLGGERAEQTIGGTANGELYSATLSKLRETVQEFITKVGPNDESSLHCLNYEGATLLRLGELKVAAAVYRQATEIARRNFGDDDDSTLTLQGNLAVTLTGMGELEEAEKLQNDTLLHREALDGTPKAHKLAITLVNLAMVKSALGDFPKARDLAEKGLTLARKSLSADDPRWGTILHNYGMVVDQAGSRAEAQQLFEQALTIRLKNSDSAGAVESLASLAASFYDVGRFEEADHRYEEAYTLATQVFPPLHPTRAKIARSYCRDLSSLGKLQQSLAMCDEALRILNAHSQENRLEMYLTEINRGVTLGLLKRDPEAIETLQTAVKGLRTYFPAYSPELYEGIRSLGVVLVDSNRVNEGAELLATALKEQRALLGDSHPDVVLTQGNYAVVVAMQGNLREAEAELSMYAKKADQMRQLYGRDQRTVRGVFSRFAATRMFLAKLLVQEGRCREAFDWMEETKSRQLRDDIREHAEIGTTSTEDRNLFVSLEQAKTRLFLERARNAGNGAKQTEIDVRLHELDERAGEIVARVQRRSASSVGDESPSTAVLNDRVRTGSTIGSFALVEQEVLVASYQSNEGFRCTSLGEWAGLYDSIWATHAIQSSVRGIPGLLTGTPLTPASRVVRTGVRSFALIPRAAPIPEGATVVTSADDVLNAMGRELLSWLVGGNTGRLIISPDGVLGLIAFDALKIDGKFLLNRLSVSEVDSFAESPVTIKTQAQSRSQAAMIAFGDPVYAVSDVPLTAVDAANKAAATIRGDEDEAVNWAPLPASAIELRSLSSLYNLIPSKTLFAKGSANVQTLRELARKGVLANTRFLVFSAHAFANVSDPELSSVVLSVPPGGSARDAYLTAVEIASLNLNSDLVFFSACDTGFGQVVTGEGVLSLSSAALVAGSRSTIHTLWSVVDSTSAEFTKQFFTYVRNGLSPEQALTRTKRSFAHKTENANPAFWAPYTLIQSSSSSLQ
jgi:CHAT domain-containing protein/tetratricopeptide (TPR) repeat protein